MATTVKLKNDGDKITIFGRETISSENLTFDKYQSLIGQYPDLAEKFELSEDKPSKKPTKDSQTANEQ